MAQKLLKSSLSLLRSRYTPRALHVSKPNHNISWRHSSTQSDPIPDRSTESSLVLTEDDRKDFFRLNDLFTVEDLMAARVHFGHKETMLNGHMRPYIFGKRLGVLIFDLDQTAKMLDRALHVAAEIAYRKGLILFIGQSRQTGYMIEAAAKDCGEYAYCRRWNSEILTNSRRRFGAVTRLPDLVIMFGTNSMSDPMHTAVIISAKMLIPLIGICDTNADPTLVTYPVPGNDDTQQSIEMYCNLFKTAILNGKSKRAEILEKYGEDFYNKTLEVSS